MEDKLKIKIWNYKNVVLYEVLEQDENLRNDCMISKHIFGASNGWTIRSLDSVQIDKCKNMYIRGTNWNKDNAVGSLSFNTIEEAKQIVKEVRQAVKEFNEALSPILTDKEREYLKAVIEPFRNRIDFITKFQLLLNEEKHYISIGLKGDTIPFPPFEKDTMYKNMELGRSYTLEELGL